MGFPHSLSKCISPYIAVMKIASYINIVAHVYTSCIQSRLDYSDNVARYTTHTIFPWPNSTQWLMIQDKKSSTEHDRLATALYAKNDNNWNRYYGRMRFLRI